MNKCNANYSMPDSPELLPQTPLPIESIRQMIVERTHVTVKEVDREDSDTRRPQGYLTVELEESDRHDLEAWIDGHLNQIESDMRPILERLEEEQRQFDGTMPSADYPYVGAFRMNYPVTKKKVREVSNRDKQAYLDSDPIWAVDVGGDDGLTDYAQKLEKALDDLVRDRMEVVPNLAQAMFERVLHGTGAMIADWRFREETRREDKTYQGFDGETAQSLQGLETFEQDYPNWKEEKSLRKLHSLIAKGATQTKEFTYLSPVANHPTLSHIPLKDIRVYPETDGFDGLRTTPLYGYVKRYTRVQMRQFVEEGTIDEDQWERVLPSSSDESLNPHEEQETHEVSHLTLRRHLAGDHRLSRYKVWFERKAKVVLRIRFYPWWYYEPDLIPLYFKEEHTGFFKPGLAWDLRDDHVALNTLLNMYLNGVDLANSMRFKAKERSHAYNYILSRRWSPHLPVPYENDPNEIQQFSVETSHLQSLIESIELMRRNADESTGTSALQSGRESPRDPRAPATKSLLLLQQVEPNTKESLRALEPGMKQVGKWILWLYYQGIALGWVPNFPGVPDLPHDQLPKLAERLQPRALLFEFDRANRVETNLAVLKMVTQAGFAEDVPTVTRIAISQMNSQWARSVDQLKLRLPTPPPTAPQTTPGAPDVSARSGNGQAMEGRLAELSQMIAAQGQP